MNGALTPKWSVLFFSADGETRATRKYDLLFDMASFADEVGFHAIWTPERHFHEFGGLYPNPAVLSAAIAARTRRIGIRAGSVIFPLHHPLRIAEDWAVVDNVSGGRVGIACALGWAKAEFVLSPQGLSSFDDRRELAMEGIRQVQRLWRGEALTVTLPEGRTTDLLTFPRPVQADLPIWLTTSGNEETWQAAGRAGLSVLCSLIGQSTAVLGKKISLYKHALAEHGHDEREKDVTVMVHTFVSERDEREWRPQVKSALSSYIESHHRQGIRAGESSAVTAEQQDRFVDFATERYLQATSLIGSPARCVAFADELRRLGVTELACLVDFGITHEMIMESLVNVGKIIAHESGSH